MKPITWHTTKHGDRVFARHRENGPLHSGTVAKVGHKYVRIQFDANGNGQREYKDVYPMREVFDAIKAGELTGMAEGKRL